MYRLLLADDEYDIIDGLKTLVPWKDYEIEVCAEAANGAQAAEQMKALSPDVIVVDINMSVMTGLEPLQWIQDENLPVKSIILSGHDNFSYAQKAIQLGAVDYLLKPCWPQQVLEAVQKAISEIETEKNREERLLHYKNQFQKHMKLWQER